MIIRLDSGAARNQLQTIGAVLDHPEDMLAESATRVERKLRGHFAERDKTANKLGGQRTHYWAQIANSTAVAEVTDRSASVDIGDGRFAQTLHGGEIRAKTPWPGSGFLLLTIPVHPAAHGRRVSVTARETGHAKPDAPIFHATCERLGVAPHEVLHVGDDPLLDVHGAREAGLRTCWINRRNEAWPEQFAPPDLQFDTLCALADWLDARHPYPETA